MVQNRGRERLPLARLSGAFTRIEPDEIETVWASFEGWRVFAGWARSISSRNPRVSAQRAEPTAELGSLAITACGVEGEHQAQHRLAMLAAKSNLWDFGAAIWTRHGCENRH